MGLPLENNLTSPKLCGTLTIELSSNAADNRVVIRRISFAMEQYVSQ
jgi:hypothetical protein